MEEPQVILETMPDPLPVEPDEGAKNSQNAGDDREAKEKKPKLSAAEQMALFEEELKKNDWGHQPC